MDVSACIFIRKLLSKWNPRTCPVSRAQTASACWAKQLGSPLQSFLTREDCHIGHMGALLARMTAEITDSGDSARV